MTVDQLRRFYIIKYVGLRFFAYEKSLHGSIIKYASKPFNVWLGYASGRRWRGVMANPLPTLADRIDNRAYWDIPADTWTIPRDKLPAETPWGCRWRYARRGSHFPALSGVDTRTAWRRTPSTKPVYHRASVGQAVRKMLLSWLTWACAKSSKFAVHSRPTTQWPSCHTSVLRNAVKNGQCRSRTVESRSELLYHPDRWTVITELFEIPFTQNFGHPGNEYRTTLALSHPLLSRGDTV